MPNREVPFADGMKFGRGYDRLTGDVKISAAVEFPSATPPPGAGQLVTADCVIVQTVETLHKALGISVDAGGSYMGFSGSAKADYAKSCDFSSFSTYAMVAVSVRNQLVSVDSPAFNDDGKELIINQHPDRFRERFGDCFIAGIKNGGEYFAIYQLTSTDSAERESLALDVQAAFRAGLGSAHLNTKISTATASSRSHLEVHVHVYREGTISEVNFEVEDILATARKFPVDVDGSQGIGYSALLADYEELRSPNDAFNFIEIQNQQDVLADLARKRFEFLELRDDLAYAQNHLADFQNSDGTALDAAAVDAERVKVIDTINMMERAAAACARDATQCQFPVFDVASFARPVLKPTATPPPSAVVLATVGVGQGPAGLALSPDGQRLYVPNSFNALKVIDTISNAVSSTITVDGGADGGFALSRNGHRIAMNATNRGTVMLVTDDAQVTQTIVPNLDAGVALSSDGGRAYVTSSVSFADPFKLEVIDTNRHEVTAEIPLGQGADVGAVVLSPDDRRVYVSHINDLIVVDVQANSVITTIPVSVVRGNVAFDANGHQLYVLNDLHPEVELAVIDTAGNTVTSRVPIGENPRSMAVSADGQRAYVSMFKELKVVDIPRGIVVASIPYATIQIGVVAIAPNGRRVFLSAETEQHSGMVNIIDADRNTVITSAAVPGVPGVLIASPDSRRVYVLDDTNTVSVINVA